jgi:hypothetical protein
MAWLLAMQGPPSKLARSLIYQVQESADRAKLAEEIASAATGPGPPGSRCLRWAAPGDTTRP